ncbi:MAG: alpha/beta fold hydrolase [Alphaproteobacteria bacterium]
MSFTEQSLLSQTDSGAHRVVYNDWGAPDGKPVVCVHGLTGNSHDFDELARVFIEHGYRLITPDLPGRGRSDFLKNPADYNYDQYCKDLRAVLSHAELENRKIDWLGVSLGGLLGIRLAGELNNSIKRLILNDVGPEVPKPALDFIQKVISQTYVFDTITDLERRMRETRGLTWGPVTDEQWKHMAEHNARALEDGSITYSYDPQIGLLFEDEPTGPTDLWPAWDKITCPVLTIRGKKSVVLTANILDEMKIRGPARAMDIAILPDCGHVPSLMAPKQIQLVLEWLNTTQI